MTQDNISNLRTIAFKLREKLLEQCTHKELRIILACSYLSDGADWNAVNDILNDETINQDFMIKQIRIMQGKSI